MAELPPLTPAEAVLDDVFSVQVVDSFGGVHDYEYSTAMILTVGGSEVLLITDLDGDEALFPLQSVSRWHRIKYAPGE